MTKEALFDFARKNAPCYIYAKDVIESNCKQLQNAVKDAEFLYSIKANPFLPVVETISSQGIGADAASSNEVLLSEQAQIPAEMIYYSAPGKTEQDILKTWGKCTFIADSLHELELLEQKAKQENTMLEVGIRIHPNFTMFDGNIVSSKFGIDEDLLFNTKWNYPHLRLTGIHVHLQSQILDSSILSRYHHNCYNLAEKVNSLAHANIKFINFGSGIGIVYDEINEKPLNISEIGQSIGEIAKKNKEGLNAKLFLETGRFLTCNAGTYFTPIIDRKISRGKTYVVVQNALNGFLRPTMSELLKKALGQESLIAPQEPFFTSVNQCNFNIIGNTNEAETVDVVGTLCTALDVMAKDISLPKSDIGDVLAVSNAGSYAFTLSPFAFSSHELPKEYLY
jgi:diaminopimelate decarboxylase